MTVYATTAQLETLGLSKEAAKKFSKEKKEEQLEASSGVVDSYLRHRYTLPLTAWGKEISEATAVHAAYSLMAGGASWNPVPGSADEHLYLRFKEKMQWLRDIAKNLATPEVTDSSTSSSLDSAMPFIESDEPRGW